MSLSNTEFPADIADLPSGKQVYADCQLKSAKITGISGKNVKLITKGIIRERE
jgi:hypothetical protein